MKALRTLLLLSLVLCALATSQLFSQTIASSAAPSFVSSGRDLGATSANESVAIKLWLTPHNAALLDQMATELNDPSSPRYRQFLSPEQSLALFAPDAADVAKVTRFLSSKGVPVTAVGDGNYFIEAAAPAAVIERAFQVKLHNYLVRGEVLRANTTAPIIDDASAAALVSSVSGLSTTRMQPYNRRPHDPKGQPVMGVVLNPNGKFFEGDCYRGVVGRSFSQSGESATYRGNLYGANIGNTTAGHLPPCGYSPQDIQTAYSLKSAYNAGIEGYGQSVVIVDAYGSTTIAKDLATFSQVYGLPSARLTVVGTPIAPGGNATIQGWMDETTLDVEWAHAIAPAAHIVLIIAPTNYSDALAGAIVKAVVQGLGNVVSNSYGEPETYDAPADFSDFEGAMKLAAVQGVAVNFSSGDDGDFVYALGYSDVSYPGSSKQATSVGGTSVLLNSDRSIRFQTSWGSNLTLISEGGGSDAEPYVPPLPEGFQFGSGGGTSRKFGKPAFQARLSGSYRRVPDISWVADPYTGVEIIETDLTAKGTPQFVGVIGGTSAACPMFSALWALAAQKHGGALGQAAPRLYTLPANAIRDVTAVAYGVDVYGAVMDQQGTITESARQLATPTPQISTFTSALYQSPYSSRYFVLTFGTDSSLNATPGWDAATGLGTPVGYSFVQAAAK